MQQPPSNHYVKLENPSLFLQFYAWSSSFEQDGLRTGIPAVLAGELPFHTAQMTALYGPYSNSTRVRRHNCSLYAALQLVI